MYFPSLATKVYSSIEESRVEYETYPKRALVVFDKSLVLFIISLLHTVFAKSLLGLTAKKLTFPFFFHSLTYGAPP